MTTTQIFAVPNTTFELPTQRLREITDFCDAVELLHELGYVDDSEMFDLTGFGHLSGERKEELIGKAFVILEMRIRDGFNGEPFAEMLIVTVEDGRKFKLRDSSSGICEQVMTILDERYERNHPNPNYFLMVKKGLRYREKPFFDEDAQKEIMTRTYFLDT